MRQEESKKQDKKLNNKGFSLVELIIVMAIMAILVGVVGTQVIPYLERARESKDYQVISSYATAAMTAYVSNVEKTGAPTGKATIFVYGTDTTATGVDEFTKAFVEDIRELTSELAPANLKSKEGAKVKDIEVVIDVTDEKNKKLIVTAVSELNGPSNTKKVTAFDPIENPM